LAAKHGNAPAMYIPSPPRQADGRASSRIEAIDLARGLALVAMAIYHFAWDLEFFGYTQAGTTAVGGWKLFARAIASTFLALVGVSLYLAHRNGIRWSSFAKRLGMIAAAAAAVTAATIVATPGNFIFFGILHHIAVASLLGLAFMRFPWPALLLLAAISIAAPHFARSEWLNAPFWWWSGLSAQFPRSSDYVPVFPWFGAVLTGMGAAKLAERTGLLERLRGRRSGSWATPLRFAGRHSLAVYLVHQPVIIGCIWLFAQMFPAAPQSLEGNFVAACEASCSETRAEAFCTAYCICVLDTLDGEGRLAEAVAPQLTPELRARVQAVAEQCTMAAEQGGSDE
jgi:uncharacterized membrane protein